jgi:hypothetical protein
VGTIWEASKRGGLNIKEWLQSRKRDPSRNRFDGEKQEADLDSVGGKADDAEEETGMCTPRNRRGRGPGTQGRIHRENVRKVPPAAGAGIYLQRFLERGLGRRRGESNGIGE